MRLNGFALTLAKTLARRRELAMRNLTTAAQHIRTVPSHRGLEIPNRMLRPRFSQ